MVCNEDARDVVSVFQMRIGKSEGGEVDEWDWEWFVVPFKKGVGFGKVCYWDKLRS